MKFKTLNKDTIDLVEYTEKYLNTHDNVKILVGCDSQNFNNKTIYAVVVAFYNPGKGAHIIFNKWKTAKENTTAIRLINEVWKSVEVAEELKKHGWDVTYIDIDINPDPKYKSNEVFRQTVGLCEGMGYKVRYKHLAPLVTTMADSIVRHG